MFPVPIETLRVRIGLDSSDASRDDDITYANDLALSLMNSYCDRIFAEQIGFEEIFTHERGVSLSLKAYPIEFITSIIDDNGSDVENYHIAKQRGLVNLDAYHAFHEVTVTYRGGYAEGAFPPDLLAAYYAIFDKEFAAIGSASSAAEISSVTVQDVGTVRFETGGSDSSTGAAHLPVTATSILDSYKRYQC